MKHKYYIVPTKHTKEYRLYVRNAGVMHYYDSFYQTHIGVIKKIGNWLYDNMVSVKKYDDDKVYELFQDELKEVGEFCNICNSGTLVYTPNEYMYAIECLDCGHERDL